MRTAGFGGFDLLDLQDFPGQGTALVGMLDAFLDSKGIISPEKWREFCAPIVLMARFEKYTWTTSETFTTTIEVAHYGERDLSDASITWTLRDGQHNPIASGKLPPVTLQSGGLRKIATISTSLSSILAPAPLQLDLSIDGTSIKTSYPLWVYPANVPIDVPAGVTLARSFDQPAQ